MKYWTGIEVGSGWGWGSGSIGTVYVHDGGWMHILPDYDCFHVYPKNSALRLAFALAMESGADRQTSVLIARDLVESIVIELSKPKWTLTEVQLSQQIAWIRMAWPNLS